MWIFTKYGFFSAVCARHGQGQAGQPVDPNRVMIRARAIDHLRRLQTRCPVLAGAEVLISPNADYAFRMFLPKEDWATIMAQIALELDYDNFKAEVDRYQKHAGADYTEALHEVWSVMNELQRRRR
jgi:hypothetical protein